MTMPKIKIQSNFCIDHENNIQKIDIYAMNDHIEINKIKDDEPLANYVDEEFIFNLLEKKTKKNIKMPKIGIANGLIDIKDSWPQNNSMNIVNDYKSKKMMKNGSSKIYEKLKVPLVSKEEKRKDQMDKKAIEFKKQNKVISVTQDLL